MGYTEESVAKLMSELEKSWKSGEEKGLFSAEDVRTHFTARRLNKDGRNPSK